MHKFSVLIIDDIEENIYSMKLILNEYFEDIEIYEALNVDEALLCIMRNDINLILSDVQMPGVDGFDLVNYLKDIEQTKDIPIILVSAMYNNSEHIKKGYELGAIDYITKPIDDEILSSKLKVYIDLYKSNNKQKEELSEKDRLLVEQIKINSMIDGLDKHDKKLKEYDGFLYDESSEIDLDRMSDVKKKIDALMEDGSND